MFNFARKDKRTALEKEIEEVIEVMSSYQPYSEEYVTMSENLERLRKAEVNKPAPTIPIEPIIIGVFQLIGMALILNHEKADVITSKAFGWIMKSRV